MQYIPTVDTKKKCGKGSSVNAAGPVVLRIQDRPLQEMRDEGKWVRARVCVVGGGGGGRRCICGRA